MWDCVSCDKIGETFSGHEGQVFDAALASSKSSGGTPTHILVTCGEDHTLRTWNVDTAECTKSIDVDKEILAITVSPDGGASWIATGDRAGRVTWWRPDKLTKIHTEETAHSSQVFALTTGATEVKTLGAGVRGVVGASIKHSSDNIDTVNDAYHNEV